MCHHQAQLKEDQLEEAKYEGLAAHLSDKAKEKERLRKAMLKKVAEDHKKRAADLKQHWKVAGAIKEQLEVCLAPPRSSPFSLLSPSLAPALSLALSLSFASS